jgi:hypothetical protein
MFSTPTHSLDINTIAEDPVMVDFINKYLSNPAKILIKYLE